MWDDKLQSIVPYEGSPMCIKESGPPIPPPDTHTFFALYICVFGLDCFVLYVVICDSGRL